MGQPLAGASLDVAASRRQIQPEQQQPSTSQIPPLPVAAVQDKVTHDDDEWQAPGSARKRKATATAAPPVIEKPKVSSSKQSETLWMHNKLNAISVLSNR